MTTVPSLSHSLRRWQVAGGCQVCVGNLHSGAENVYCRERTFALWSHLLLVTSRFLIFYHRKFLVDHKSNPLSPAAGGGWWWGGETVRRAAGLSLSLQRGAEHLCPAKCKLLCSSNNVKMNYTGGQRSSEPLLCCILCKQKNVLEDVLCIVTRYCKIIFRLHVFEALGNTTV